MTPGGFGSPDGLPQRLATWANQLSRDKKYPWVGTGLIDDLKCAAKQMGVDFDVLFPPVVFAPKPAVEEEDEFANFKPAEPATFTNGAGWDL